MDWTRAIEVNRSAFFTIVTGLLAVLAAFDGVLRLPRRIHSGLSLDLYKAEAAVRRLIVMAAQGLVVPPQVHRPMPAGLVISSKAQGGPSRLPFPLCDRRVSYSFEEPGPAALPPFIRVIDDPSPRQQFLSLFARPESNLSSEAETRSLRLRFAATSRALDNLPAEARRMLRWQNRRLRMAAPKFISPLRPGPPPGSNKWRKQEIDLVLRECHALARAAPIINTS